MGQTKEVFKDRHEFTGSLFRQIDDVTRIIDSNNRLSSPKINGVRREDYRDYPVEAIREALLNAVVHRDYAMNGDTLISMFSDRIEFISLGGLGARRGNGGRNDGRLISSQPQACRYILPPAPY